MAKSMTTTGQLAAVTSAPRLSAARSGRAEAMRSSAVESSSILPASIATFALIRSPVPRSARVPPVDVRSRAGRRRVRLGCRPASAWSERSRRAASNATSASDSPIAQERCSTLADRVSSEAPPIAGAGRRARRRRRCSLGWPNCAQTAGGGNVSATVYRGCSRRRRPSTQARIACWPGATARPRTSRRTGWTDRARAVRRAGHRRAAASSPSRRSSRRPPRRRGRGGNRARAVGQASGPSAATYFVPRPSVRSRRAASCQDTGEHRGATSLLISATGRRAAHRRALFD